MLLASVGSPTLMPAIVLKVNDALCDGGYLVLESNSFKLIRAFGSPVIACRGKLRSR